MITRVKVKNRVTAVNFSKSRMLSQHGLTLIELLVALVISSVIAIAAVSALIVSRQGFSTVDAASQLRDNSRFAVDLIQRLALQSGFKDIQYAATVRQAISTVALANITGYNDQKPDVSATDPSTSMLSWGTSEGGKGSDVLILRYQPSKLFADATTTDKSMINCMGAAATFVPLNRDDRMTSILYINTSLGEPSLMCSATTANNNTWPSPATGQPIISGVENMQILYGVESVTANAAPAANLADTSYPNLYLRADQMVVAGNANATNLNWQRVRSIRIGMVLRGPLGSAQGNVSSTLYPLGQAASSTGGAAGSAMSSTTDVGTVFVTPADTRLRQVVTFTVHLRNEQGN